MFAPHCPTCETRVLLGIGRIVHLAAAPGGGPVVVLRCRCGGLVTWESQPPARQAGSEASPPSEQPVPADLPLSAELPEAVPA